MNKIKVTREAKGISKKELAEKLNVSPPTITAIENGTLTCSVPLAKKIAAELGCLMDYLFMED